MNKEIGGYIELDTYHLPMLHEGAVALNCGRNALAYVIRARKIRKIRIPRFLCASVQEVCEREQAAFSYYDIGTDFLPAGNTELAEDEWLYLVNFYSQLGNEQIDGYVRKYQRIIVDNAQSYFQMPLPHVDTLYTCRKYFGVADGAFLYTDAACEDALPQDESFDRMHFLLGRYERTASEFYAEYAANNEFFAKEPLKRMSLLTGNLLHGIDYPQVEQRRADNYAYLNEQLHSRNLLSPKPGTFMYPFMIENGAKVRKELQARKIYIPTLWPDVYGITSPEDAEYRMAENILPLPVDQRYGISEMQYMVQEILDCMR